MRQVFTFLFLSVLLSVSIRAEKITEYSTTFNSAEEQNEWEAIRESGESFYYWDYNSKTNNPNDRYAFHDYNVGGAETDTVRDWFISPKLVYHKGAKCQFEYNLFSMMGSRMATDQFQVYYCTGDSDPYDATYTQIIDLSDSLNGQEFTMTAFELPYSDIPGEKDSCYIAFFYQSTINWYIPGIDNFNVYYESSAVKENDFNIQVITKLSNSANYLEIKSDSRYYPLTVEIFDIYGRKVQNGSLLSDGILNLNQLNNGVYLYKVLSSGTMIKTGKINI